MITFERTTVLPLAAEAAFDLSLNIDAHVGSMAASGEQAGQLSTLDPLEHRNLRLVEVDRRQAPLDLRIEGEGEGQLVGQVDEPGVAVVARRVASTGCLSRRAIHAGRSPRIELCPVCELCNTAVRQRFPRHDT